MVVVLQLVVFLLHLFVGEFFTYLGGAVVASFGGRLFRLQQISDNLMSACGQIPYLCRVVVAVSVGSLLLLG